MRKPRFSCEASPSYSEIGHVGIGLICGVRPALHVGAIYRAGAVHQFIHVLPNGEIASNDVRYPILWGEPTAPDWLAQNVSAMLNLIYARMRDQRVPYSFFRGGLVFDRATGMLRRSEQVERGGLNCATFVIAAFECGGLRLIDSPAWEGKDFADRLRDMLDQMEIIAGIEATSGVRHSARETAGLEVCVRPEEVLAAACVDELPSTLEGIWPILDEIDVLLDQWEATGGNVIN